MSIDPDNPEQVNERLEKLREANKIIHKLKNDRETKNQIEAKKQRLPRITVEAIEFGWIHNNKEGVAFLKNLAENDSTEIFDLKIIRIIIIYLWIQYK